MTKIYLCMLSFMPLCFQTKPARVTPALFWDILETSRLDLLHCRRCAHLADAGLGKEQHADKKSFLKYFLAVANKVRLMFHYIWKENSRAK